jgi:hypothetical protein
VGGPPRRDLIGRIGIVVALIAVLTLTAGWLVRVHHGSSGKSVVTPSVWPGETLSRDVYVDANSADVATTSGGVKLGMGLTVGNAGHAPITVYALGPAGVALQMSAVREAAGPVATVTRNTGAFSPALVIAPGHLVAIQATFAATQCPVEAVSLLVTAQLGNDARQVVAVAPGGGIGASWAPSDSCG